MESKKMADNSNSRMQLQLHNQQQSNLTSNYNNMQMGFNNFDANQQLLGMYGNQMGFINTTNNNINNNSFNNNHHHQQQQQQQQQMGLSRMPRNKSEIQRFGPGVNSAEQTLQAMGMINNNLNMNSHLRTNENLTISQQRFNLQLRQKILEQVSLASITAQGLQRTPYMNVHLSELAQNGQQAMPQNSVSQRQWSNQMPAMHTTNSHSYRVQQHRQPQTVPQYHLAASPQLPQNSMGLSPQQLAQIAQQQQQQQQKLLNQQPQSCPRVIVPTGQKSISLTGSQPYNITASGGSSSQVTEASNLLLGKRKIQDLVSQVDPRGRLDPEVEDLLLELADDFIDSVTTFACSLAKHRKSTTLETKDVLLHLEKNWNLTVPGFSREERKNRHNPVSNELHKTHLDTIRALMEPSQSPINNGKEVARHGIINPDGVNHMMRPSLSSDQLVSQSNASQIGQKLYRF